MGKSTCCVSKRSWFQIPTEKPHKANVFITEWKVERSGPESPYTHSSVKQTRNPRNNSLYICLTASLLFDIFPKRIANGEGTAFFNICLNPKPYIKKLTQNGSHSQM